MPDHEGRQDIQEQPRLTEQKGSSSEAGSAFTTPDPAGLTKSRPHSSGRTEDRGADTGARGLGCMGVGRKLCGAGGGIEPPTLRSIIIASDRASGSNASLDQFPELSVSSFVSILGGFATSGTSMLESLLAATAPCTREASEDPSRPSSFIKPSMTGACAR